jgi:hypothetical protein
MRSLFYSAASSILFCSATSWNANESCIMFSHLSEGYIQNSDSLKTPVERWNFGTFFTSLIFTGFEIESSGTWYNDHWANGQLSLK